MYLLDSNVLSELRPTKPVRSAPVLAWAASQDSDLFYLSAITLFEQEIGILRLERRQPPQGRQLRAWATGARQLFYSRTLPVTSEIAIRSAALHVPDPMPERDALIAATALVHGLVLVTRNVRDFDKVAGLRLLNPWEFKA